MKTDDLISLLATGADAVAPHVAARRFALAIGAGLAGAALLMATLLGVRPDLVEVASLPMFWVKVGFVAGLTVAGLFAASRLSRPGVVLGRVPGTIGALVLVMWVIAIYTLSAASPEQRLDLFLGQTWRSCPFLIALLSVPVFIAVIWAMRGMAPTRPRFAGFAAGLLSGATAALVYCLHCPEIEAPFVAFWYLLGMLIPAGAGAWFGEYLLRW